MKLKLITVDKRTYAIKTRYIELNSDASVHYRSPITGKFPTGDDDTITDVLRSAPPTAVAVVYSCNREPIYIEKHDGAYVISEAKTIEIVNQPVDFDDVDFWVNTKGEEEWKKVGLGYYIEYSRVHLNDSYQVAQKDFNLNEKMQGIVHLPNGQLGKAVRWYLNGSRTWLRVTEGMSEDILSKLTVITILDGKNPNDPGYKLP
jgi:hypothetical protein